MKTNLNSGAGCLASGHVKVGFPVVADLPVEAAEEHHEAGPEGLIAKLEACFFGRHGPLLAVALLAGSHEVIPGVAPSE